MRWDGPDGYFADDDVALVDIKRVHRWMSEESYWAAGPTRRWRGRSRIP